MSSISNSSYDASIEYSESSSQSIPFPVSSSKKQSEHTPTSFSGLFSIGKGNVEENKPKSFFGRTTPISNLRYSTPSTYTPKKLLRPSSSYSQLVRDVLLDHDMLTTFDICEILSKKHPSYFSMDDRKWKANVRNCLSSKSDFMKDCSRKGKSYWTLCPKVKAKLKSPVYYEFDAMKENVLPLSRSASKFVHIAPKLYHYNSSSQDCFRERNDRQSTPLKLVENDSVNRKCQSEDKNLNRYRRTTFKRELCREASLLEAPKKKLFTESDSCSMKLTIKSGSITFSPASTQTSFISEDDENASFPETLCTDSSDLEGVKRNAITGFLPLSTGKSTPSLITNNTTNVCLESTASDVIKTEQSKENDEMQEIFSELSQDSLSMSPVYGESSTHRIDFSLLDQLDDL